MIRISNVFLFLILTNCFFGQDTIKIRKSISECLCTVSFNDTTFNSALKVITVHHQTKEILLDSITVIAYKMDNPEEKYCSIVRDSSFYVLVPPANWGVTVCSPLFQKKSVMNMPVGTGKTVIVQIDLTENEKSKKKKEKKK